MGVLKTSDQIQIRLYMPNPIKKPPASSKISEPGANKCKSKLFMNILLGKKNYQINYHQVKNGHLLYLWISFGPSWFRKVALGVMKILKMNANPHKLTWIKLWDWYPWFNIPEYVQQSYNLAGKLANPDLMHFTYCEPVIWENQGWWKFIIY